MPRTKLNNLIDKQKALKNKKIATRTKRIQKENIKPTPKDYKLFCDTVFMCYIRYRDGWKCGLTGKQFDVGDYPKYQACHFVPKSRLAGRYLPENCHGQSAWCNYQESLGNPYWVKRFTDFMIEKYGEEKVNEIFKLNFTHTKWGIKDWREQSKNTYSLALSMDNGEQILNERLNFVFKSIKQKIILDYIKNEINAHTNDFS